MSRLLPIGLLALLAAGCDTATETCDGADCLPPGRTVYVGNQGNFTDQTGSVTAYDVDAGAAAQGAFGIGAALVQQVVVDPENADRGYVLLNYNDSFSTGRGLVAVVDLAEGQRLADVPVNTPRGAARLGTTLWVTSLYGNTVTPIDLATFTAGDSIAVGMNPEGVAAAGGRVYVANAAFGFGTTLSVIEAGGDAAATLPLDGCDGPRALGVDAEDELWVFCTGKTVYDGDYNVIERTNGAVVVLDGATADVVAAIPLDDQIGAASLGQDAFVDAAEDEAWAVRVDGALLRFDTAANALVGVVAPEVPDGSLVGAVASEGGHVYVGAVAPDFVSAGQLVVLDRDGRRLASAAAGVIPAALAVR
jgi:hypothetical protein